MKLLIVCVLFATLAAINAQAAFMGTFPPTDFFQNFVLQQQAQKLLMTADFPEDLQNRVVKSMSDAETGFNNCITGTYAMPWMQKVCVTMQLAKTKNDLKAIESEYTARVAAATATTGDAALV